ncbi:hypothetical protein QUF76_16565 [Desulfobacterales bacterium HSG16]|nr:hypothetical protein [Desulfobacterales bacterium HSG16]
MKRPEDYRWSSLGYHIQSKNEDNFLSTDFGLAEFNVLDENERLRRYRRYVYEAGALKRPDKNLVQTIDIDILEKEREADFNIGRIQRFTYRTRYFTDSGIIVSKAFVMENYQRFKGHFQTKNEKKPKSIKGRMGYIR